jgi:tetratricopeptide (TPR) repeat protein/transcriptional regulator with XRE-family HTH domain
MDSPTFTTFGELLRFLRRQSRLTQRDLGIAVGYSEGHINRYEKNKCLPDPSMVAALIVPALHLEHDSSHAKRLVELAQTRPLQSASHPAASSAFLDLIETIPPAPAFEIERHQILKRLNTSLSLERRILLSGLAGMGKTSLAAALARDHAGRMPVFWYILTGGITTSVDSLVYQLALFLAGLGHSQIKSLLQPPSSQPPPSLDRLLLLIGNALNRQPVLLCFDNAETIAVDQAILQVLQHLCAVSSASMLLTSRESLPLKGICEITLPGLNREEGLTLIGYLSDGQLNPEQALRLFEKTDGNPLLIRLAVAQLMVGQVDATPFIESLDTQPQVISYLLETVQKQSLPTEWLILSLLAVFLQPVNLYDETLETLIRQFGLAQPVGEAIAALQNRHLIDHPDQAALNPLVREYVYRTMSVDSTRRQRLNRLAGDWYTETRQAGLSAARHYAAAGLLDETIESITQNEKEIVANGQALAAVAVLDELSSRGRKRRTQTDDALRRLLVARGCLLGATIRSAEAEENFRQALALATNPAVRADIVFRMWPVMAQRGHLAEELQLIQSVRAELPPVDQLLHAQLLVAECNTLRVLGQLEPARQSAQQAIALADHLERISVLSAENIRAEACYTLANIARQMRQSEAAIDQARRALTSARRAGMKIREISCLAFIGGMLYDTGDLDGSLEYRQKALQAAQAIGDEIGVGYYLTNLAIIDHLQLRPLEAQKKLDQAVQILDDAGEIRGLAGALSLYASNALLRRNIVQAKAAILRVINELEGDATRLSWGYYLNKLAILQMLQGEATQAQATLTRAIIIADVSNNRMLNFELNTNLAFIQAANGDPDAAQRTLDASPRFDGLSIWTALDRDLIDGCVALAAGNQEQASCIAGQMFEQTHSCPYYHRMAVKLVEALRTGVPVSSLSNLLWVGTD